MIREKREKEGRGILFFSEMVDINSDNSSQASRNWNKPHFLFCQICRDEKRRPVEVMVPLLGAWQSWWKIHISETVIIYLDKRFCVLRISGPWVIV